MSSHPMHIFLVKNVLFLLQKSNALVTKTSSPIKGHPLTFGTFNMTFKGHVHLKTLNLASCMSIGRFLWSRNPNTARKWPYARSKVILVTFKTFNMTFEGHIYLKIPNLASCISIGCFLGQVIQIWHENCSLIVQRSTLSI